MSTSPGCSGSTPPCSTFAYQPGRQLSDPEIRARLAGEGPRQRHRQMGHGQHRGRGSGLQDFPALLSIQFSHGLHMFSIHLLTVWWCVLNRTYGFSARVSYRVDATAKRRLQSRARSSAGGYDDVRDLAGGP